LKICLRRKDKLLETKCVKDSPEAEVDRAEAEVDQAEAEGGRVVDGILAEDDNITIQMR
jgi:hypothetical protein